MSIIESIIWISSFPKLNIFRCTYRSFKISKSDHFSHQTYHFSCMFGIFFWRNIKVFCSHQNNLWVICTSQTYIQVQSHLQHKAIYVFYSSNFFKGDNNEISSIRLMHYNFRLFNFLEFKSREPMHCWNY